MKAENQHIDKKAIVKKIVEDKKKIHEFIRAGKPLTQLAKERKITFARPV